MVDYGQLHFNYLYEDGPEAKFSEEQLRLDPWLSCKRNMVKDINIAREIDSADRLVDLLADDHRIITNGVNNKCIFVNHGLTPILEGQIFRVGSYVDVDEQNARWTWDLKYRNQFIAFPIIVDKLAGLKEFVSRHVSVLDCAELMQMLRICAIMIDCNYVDLRGGGGFFIRGLRLVDGVCICGKNGDMRCGRCKKSYCSKECQRADWPNHKSSCKA